MIKGLLVVLFLATAFVFGGIAFAQNEADFPNIAKGNRVIRGIEEGARALEAQQDVGSRRVSAEQFWQENLPTSSTILVAKNQYGDEVGMLPPVNSLPSVSLPAMPVDAVRPPRPVAPQAPSAARQPPAPPVPASPQAPKPPAETAAKVAVAPKDYPRGEVVSDQAKKLYLKGQLVGEIRARKGRLKGELVNVDQNALHIDIRPGNYLSRIAIPVDRGLYKIAFATGKGWVFLPEKTNKVPAGCESVQIGD